MNAIFSSPTRYTQGWKATESLAKELTILGLRGPILIVTSKSPRKILESTWTTTLESKGFYFSIHDFLGECSAQEVTRITEAAKQLSCKVILGAGGGKVIDAARAAAATLSLPFISCPTIASSDAPCSAISIIYSEEGVFEEVRYHPQNPTLVLVDTNVIAHAPERMLIAGMGDALSTVFEARACSLAKKPNTRGGASTMAALSLAELCYQTLLSDGEQALQALRKQSVTPALERIIETNTLLSGLGFESAGLAAAHAIHNGLTILPETHPYFHGEKVAFGVIVQLVLEGSHSDQLHEVLSFSRKIGLPTTLADIGCGAITDKQIMQVAERATLPSESIHNEPFPVTSQMVAEAIRTADSAGQNLPQLIERQ